MYLLINLLIPFGRIYVSTKRLGTQMLIALVLVIRKKKQPGRGMREISAVGEMFCIA